MADFLEIKDTQDLQRLVDDDIQESLTLEYKRSDALGRSNAQREELCKDVSAFANSAGGQIVYGIQEQDHHPVQVDSGTDGAGITREWIEQVINSNIQPRLHGLVITPISLEAGRYAYVLSVPASSTAHQASDKKYYKRFNFQSVAMHDYEIRDVMKRSSNAAPFVHLSFDRGSNTAAARLESGGTACFVRAHFREGRQ